MTSNSKNNDDLPRFGLASLVCLIIANMIGAGVYTTSGFAFADLGSRKLVMIAWAIGGVIALCGAVSYGGLARAISGSGGEYLFLSRTIHPLAGFLAGWVSLLAGFTSAIAFAAMTFEAYAAEALPTVAGNIPKNATAILVILICGVVHSFAVRPGLMAQNLLIAFKLLVLGGFVGFAAWQWSGGAWPGWHVADTVKAAMPAGSAFPVGKIALSLVWISLSFSGFNAAIYVAGEVADAERTVPRALWIGTFVTFVVYLLLNFIFVYAALPDDVRGAQEIAIVAANALDGPGATGANRTNEVFAFFRVAGVIRLAILASLFSSVSSMIVAGPRVYAKMAEDGVFPGWLKMYQQRPVAAVWMQVIFAAAIVSISNLRELLTYLGLTLSLSAAATVCCLFVIHRREGRAAIRVPGYPFTPIFFVFATVGLAILSAPRTPKVFAIMVVTMLFGIVVYFAQRALARR